MGRADHLYRRNLAGVHGGLLSLLALLWQRYNGGGATGAGIYTVAAMLGAFTVAGQSRSVALAQSYLGDLTSLGAVFASPDALIGTTASGVPIMQIAAMAVSLYWRRRELGWSERDAAFSSRAILANLAASEPYRLANATITLNAGAHPAFTGRMRRVISGGACEFCRSIAGRGYTDAAAGFAAHRYCQCTAAPEVRTA